MEIQLEVLDYQRTAIDSAVKLFEGLEKNTFDNTFRDGLRSNVCSLTEEAILENVKAIAKSNGLDENTAQACPSKDFCVEMETGTGKTLVYLQTIHELYKHYGFTKFIVLVPSVAIRQGMLTTLRTFER